MSDTLQTTKRPRVLSIRGLARQLHRLMPRPGPTPEVGWEQAMTPVLRPSDYAAASISVASVIAIFATVFWLLPATRYSAITAFGLGVGKLVGSDQAGLIASSLLLDVVLLRLAIYIWKRKPALTQLAMREEIEYRAGAEDWSLGERWTSNLIFGTAHVFNLFVPLAAVLALGSAGFWFMWRYRRAYRARPSRTYALEQSAAMHTAHNRLVFRVLLPLNIGYFLIFVIR